MYAGCVCALALFALTVASSESAFAQHFVRSVRPEQRTIQIRNPAALPRAAIPGGTSPPTVADLQLGKPPRLLSLDDAIRVALENSQVIRILVGVQSVSSGQTIYDAAIANTAIDEQQGRFDPAVAVENSFNRFESPQAALDPLDPTRAVITGLRTDDYNMRMNLSKTTITGGSLDFGVNTNPQRFRLGVFPLNPQNRSSADLTFTQPLLQSGGIGPNRAPIVIARIDTERSFFRYKDSVQEMVRGVIEAYWGIVFARVNVWSIEQQIEQSQFAYELSDARKRNGFATAADVAQTRLALANFQASVITARADLLQREAALRNILGVPPTDINRIVPVTPPSTEQQNFDWHAILHVAQEQRPDLIELKLIIEADEQLLLQSRNQALPRVDAVALYRWNGLEGRMPDSTLLSTRGGQFADWTLGVNFSVPIGLRQSRAGLRRQELIVARDRANLQQGLHSTAHILAGNFRSLAQFYEQYKALKAARAAARANLDQQQGEFRAGRVIFLNVLQAITNWGTAVSAEAQALAQYNTELANLERQTGTILQTHGIRFIEERYGSLGPLGRLHRDVPYPSAMRPGPNANRYPATSEPAEKIFNLERPSPTGR